MAFRIVGLKTYYSTKEIVFCFCFEKGGAHTPLAPPPPLTTALSMWPSDGENIFLNHDIESLNTDDVLSVVLKIERENAIKSDVFSITFLLVNWNNEIKVYSSYWDDIFLRQIKVRKRNNLAVLNDFTVLKSKST